MTALGARDPVTETATGLPPGLPPAPAPRGAPLTDRWAVVAAASCWAGAWWHPGVGPWVAALVVVAAVVGRRPALVAVAGFALAACLCTRSLAGLDPVAPGPFEGTVTLLGDPSALPYGARVDVRAGGRRVELVATGAAAGTVGSALAGERLSVSGTLRPPPPHAPWLVPRHVVGRLTATHAEAVGAGSGPWRAANRVRRLLTRGARVLPEPERGLYGGFVLGDDRDQPPEIVDDFRGAGLTHLLVVSGQNVAFVLLLVRPVVERMGWSGRWAVTVAVIAAFGVLTRFEPSVLRAAAMAAVSVTAGAVGRPASSLRTLALAVGGLVLVDPLLVWSVGFQLSVGASLGIALWSAPLAALVPGPRLLGEALGVTVAAQAGVAPVLVPRFGGLPVVALAANVAAVPVAGLVTSWGLPAGLVAGAAGARVAGIAHLPTRLMIAWVAWVARVSSSVPLGRLGPAALAVLAAALVVLVATRRPRRRHRPGWVASARVVAWLAIVVTLVAPAWRLRSPPPRQVVAGSASLYRAGGATAVVSTGSPSPTDLLEGLRNAGVRRIDVLVADEARLDALRALLAHRWTVARVVSAAPERPVRLAIGGLVVVAERGRDPSVTTGRVRP